MTLEVAIHLPYLKLLFWDELGQFIPAALDLYHDGAWVPHSTLPNVHPPGLANLRFLHPLHQACHAGDRVGGRRRSNRTGIVVGAAIIIVSFTARLQECCGRRNAAPFPLGSSRAQAKLEYPF